MQQCRKALEMDPTFALAPACLADSYEHKGMHLDAMAEIPQGMKLPGGSSPWWLGFLGVVYARAGQREKAIAVLNELKSRAKREFVSAEAWVGIYAELGYRDQAMAYLQKAYEERSNMVTGLKGDPLFDPLRSDPRFRTW